MHLLKGVCLLPPLDLFVQAHGHDIPALSSISDKRLDAGLYLEIKRSA